MENTDKTKNFISLLDSFIQKVQGLYLTYMETRFPNLPKDELTYKVNSKYIKVIQRNSVFCFVDTTNGNILFPSGWNKPDLKNPRGNLFSEQGGMEAITQNHRGQTMHPHIKYLKA